MEVVELSNTLTLKITNPLITTLSWFSLTILVVVVVESQLQSPVVHGRRCEALWAARWLILSSGSTTTIG
ncbi:hypothetical protein V5049_13580 [Moellerella wisconsensis]|uniref:hypothetical protein n=1 Tax=Moellerella wisconsensis TaxID=158849 RepID=UPI003076873B